MKKVVLVESVNGTERLRVERRWANPMKTDHESDPVVDIRIELGVNPATMGDAIVDMHGSLSVPAATALRDALNDILAGRTEWPDQPSDF